MDFDEIFQRAGRLWQQLSVLVVLHVFFLVLALAAGVVSFHTAVTEVRGIEVDTVLFNLKKFQTDNLEAIKLDLPFVAAVLAVIYVVMFQRLSYTIGQLPLLRLSYSQTGLWRASKCFDELRQLIHRLEGFTASPSLEDLEVTLGIAIAQFRKEYSDHYEEIVNERLQMAGLWLQYYSGLCLLTLFSLGILMTLHRVPRGWVLPVGLLVAAMVTRCGWEAQIEHAVLGRLRFALNCAAISQQSPQTSNSTVEFGDEERNAADSEPLIVYDVKNLPSIDFDNFLWGDAVWFREFSMRAIDRPGKFPLRASRLLLKDLELAANLSMLPTPSLPYQRIWLLFYLRLVLPFGHIGALPFVRNEEFREWLYRSTRYMRRNIENCCRSVRHTRDQSYVMQVPHDLLDLYDHHMRGIECPQPVPDTGLIARSLWLTAGIFRMLLGATNRYGRKNTVQGIPPISDNTLEPQPRPLPPFRVWLAKKGP